MKNSGAYRKLMNYDILCWWITTRSEWKNSIKIFSFNPINNGSKQFFFLIIWNPIDSSFRWKPNGTDHFWHNSGLILLSKINFSNQKEAAAFEWRRQLLDSTFTFLAFFSLLFLSVCVYNELKTLKLVVLCFSLESGIPDFNFVPTGYGWCICAWRQKELWNA